MAPKAKKRKVESSDSSNNKITKKTLRSDKRKDKQKTTNKKKSDNSKIKQNTETFKEFQCHLCPKNFVRKEHLVIHSRIHTGERPFVCSICDHNFSDHSNLRKHLKVKHKEPKPFACPFLNCKQTFSSRNSLLQHKKSHSEDLKQKLKCDICDKNYLCRFSLSRHIRDSHGSPYTCGECSKSFCSKHEFQTHENVNTFPPKVCRQDVLKVKIPLETFKVTNLVNNCKENKRTKKQNPETDFSCDICNVKFGYRRNLYAHLQELHGTPYKCNACNRSLTSSMELNKHMQVIHRKSTVCRKDNDCEKDNMLCIDLTEESTSDVSEVASDNLDNSSTKGSHNSKLCAQEEEFTDNILINDENEEEILCVVCQKNIKSQKFWEHKMRHLRVVDLSIENISLINNNLKQNIVKTNEGKFYVGNVEEVMSGKNNLVIIHHDILKEEFDVDDKTAISGEFTLFNDDIKEDTNTVEAPFQVE